jgi:uncharacterized protein YcgL (UPF0745 family)
MPFFKLVYSYSKAHQKHLKDRKVLSSLNLKFRNFVSFLSEVFTTPVLQNGKIVVIRSVLLQQVSHHEFFLQMPVHSEDHMNHHLHHLMGGDFEC